MAKRPKNEELIGLYLPLAVILIVLAVGWLLIPEEFEVEPEYISAILASSSILFGFWAVALGLNPSRREVKEMYSLLIGLIALFNIVFLASSVIMVFFVAGGMLLSKYALTFAAISFVFNATVLTWYIYLFFIKRQAFG